MAGELMGRAACPECNFESAHIKRSAKCVYRWCPECGATYHATGEARAARLLAKMRPEGAARPDIKAPAAAPASVALESVPTPTPTPTPKAPAAAPASVALESVPTPTPTPTPTPEQEMVPEKPRSFFDI